MGAIFRTYRGVALGLTATRPGAVVMRNVLPLVDRAALAVTRGRHNVTEHLLPTLVLTTTGRRSGNRIDRPLCYVTDGSDLIVVGTNWGQADHPTWTNNLLADARAGVLVDGRSFDVVADLVEGPDWQRLYAIFEAMGPIYVNYRRRIVGRQPRMFRLTPA